MLVNLHSRVMKPAFFSKILFVVSLLAPQMALAVSPLEAIKNCLNRIDRVKLSYASFGVEIGIAPKPTKAGESGFQERTYTGKDFRISWPDNANWSATTNPALTGTTDFYSPFGDAAVPIEIRNNSPSGNLFSLNVYVAVAPRANASLQQMVNASTANWKTWQIVEARNYGPEQALITLYKGISEKLGYVVFQRIVLTSDRAYFLNAGVASTMPAGVGYQNDLLTILNSFTVSARN